MAITVLAIISVLVAQFLASSARSVTYPGFGTFTDKDFYDPKYRPSVDLPWSPEKCDPVFMLYTRKNPLVNQDQRLVYDDPYYFEESNFNPAHPTKIIVHGFSDNTEFGHWMHDMGLKFLEQNETNVIIVDWGKASQFPNYVQAVANTRIVGIMIGKLIETAVNTTGATYDSFHILGHSLGAHVAGYAGKYLNGQIGRITGFDPAGPEYEGLKNPAARLWHTDAKFVDAIHSDGTKMGFGMYETCAHVDIFPNGAEEQPGCNSERFTTIIIKGLFDGVRELVACNHMRAVDYYLESLNGWQRENAKAYMCDSYTAFNRGECTDCGENGEKCVYLDSQIDQQIQDTNATQGQRFFVATDGEEPYLKHQFLVKISLGQQSEHQGKFILTITDEKGNTDNCDFTAKEAHLHSEKTYSQVLVFSTDSAEITNMEFEWSHNLNIRPSTIHVESVEFTSLSTDKGVKTGANSKFVNPNPEEGIRNGHKVYFVKQ